MRISDWSSDVCSSDLVQTCARCHGGEDRPPLSALAPRLHGQPQEMLMRALQAYAAGERYSGIMQPIATGLSARSMQVLSTYYSGLPPLAPRQPAPGPDEQLGDGSGRAPVCQYVSPTVVP